MKVNIGFPDNQFDSPLCHTKLAGWTWDSHSSVETLLAPFTSQGLYSDEPERIPSRTVLPGATEEEVIGSTLTLQPPNCARTGHGHPQDGCLVPWAGAWPEYSPCCPNGQWSGPGVHSQENSSSEEVFFFLTSVFWPFSLFQGCLPDVTIWMSTWQASMNPWTRLNGPWTRLNGPSNHSQDDFTGEKKRRQL